MGGRGTSEEFESLDPTTPAWTTKATPNNGSYPLTCDSMNMIPYVLTLVIASIGLAGNAVVLWLLGFRIRRNAFSVYILNLAAADSLFLYCLFLVCLTIILTVYNQVHFYINYAVYFIFNNVAIVFYIVGLSMLSAISTERCLSILWPIWYRCKRPRNMSAVLCTLLWAISVVLGILRSLICHIQHYSLKWCMNVDFFITAWLMFLCIILSVSSLALLGRILCGSKRKPMTKLYVTVLFILLIFFLCGLPFGITLFLLVWIHKDFNAFLCLYMAINVLSSINSCANPFIYFFVGFSRQWQQQRPTLKMILQRALQDDCEGNLPQRTLEMLGSRGERHGRASARTYVCP